MLDEAIQLVAECGINPIVGSLETIRALQENLASIVESSSFSESLTRVLFYEALGPKLTDVLQGVVRTIKYPRRAICECNEVINDLAAKELSAVELSNSKLCTYSDASATASLLHDLNRRSRIIKELQRLLVDKFHEEKSRSCDVFKKTIVDEYAAVISAGRSVDSSLADTSLESVQPEKQRVSCRSVTFDENLQISTYDPEDDVDPDTLSLEGVSPDNSDQSNFEDSEDDLTRSVSNLQLVDDGDQSNFGGESGDEDDYGERPFEFVGAASRDERLRIGSGTLKLDDDWKYEEVVDTDA